MNPFNKNIPILYKVLNALEKLDLSPSDIESIMDGNYTISLKVTKNNKSKRTPLKDPSFNFSEIILKLKACDDKESGYAIINTSFENKKQLEALAKEANIYIMKPDKIAKIKERIVEGIIGAKLRSNAIQDNT